MIFSQEPGSLKRHLSHLVFETLPESVPRECAEVVLFRASQNWNRPLKKKSSRPNEKVSRSEAATHEEKRKGGKGIEKAIKVRSFSKERNEKPKERTEKSRSTILTNHQQQGARSVPKSAFLARQFSKDDSLLTLGGSETESTTQHSWRWEEQEQQPLGGSFNSTRKYRHSGKLPKFGIATQRDRALKE